MDAVKIGWHRKSAIAVAALSNANKWTEAEMNEFMSVVERYALMTMGQTVYPEDVVNVADIIGVKPADWKR